MDMQHIGPVSSTVPFYFKINHKSRVVYVAILLILLAAGVALPFINLPVTVHYRGIVRPVHDNIEIISPLSGMIESCNKQEGDYVFRGDTILQFNIKRMEKEFELLTAKRYLIDKYLEDLALIIKGDSLPETEKYRSESATYNHILDDKKSREKQIHKNLLRLQPLLKDSLISKKELEDLEYELLQAKNEIISVSNSYINKWLNEKEDLKKELDQVSEKLEALRENIFRSVIRAPVQGFIMEMTGIAESGYVSQHQKILKITADTSFYAEIYINPSDIGWITPGSKGRILIDAFDSNYWGALETECMYINDDIHWINNQPFFLARCKIGTKKISSGEGHCALIRKGMTLTVQFIITERTLFQLLTDRIQNFFSVQHGVK